MRVFVYGTLMRGRANHRVLVQLGARFVGEATAAERRTLVDLGPYPALLPRDAERDGATGARVRGEVYEVDDACVADLDTFEGCPELYRRERIAVVMEGAGDERAGEAAGGAGAGAAEERGAEVVVDTYVLARKWREAQARVIADGRYVGNGRELVIDATEAGDVMEAIEGDE